MNRIQTRHSVMVASLIAAGLVFGTANAETITVNATLDPVTGTVETGSNAKQESFGDSQHNTYANLNFSVSGVGTDADRLGNSSDPVTFMTQIMGSTSAGDITLKASKNFDSGMQLAAFLLGNAGSPTSFAGDDSTVTLSSALGQNQKVSNGIAQLRNLKFSSDDHKLSTLTGGTLVLAGDSNVGNTLSLSSDLNNGSGTITAKGMVDTGGGDTGNGGGDMGDNGMTGGDNGMTGGDNGMTGGDNGMTGGDNGMSGGDNGMSGGTGGGATDVPAPGSFGMGLLALAGIGGLVATRRRQGRGSDLAV